MRTISTRRWIGVAALFVWAASLCLPAIQLCAVHRYMEVQQFSREGLWFLIGGWGGIFDGQLGWIANPALLSASAFLLGGRRPWLPLSVACLGLALIPLWQSDYVFQFEGGPYRNCGFGPGFWLWLTACALPAAWSLLERFGVATPTPLRPER